MRSLMLAAAAAVMFSTSAFAAAGGTYTLDTRGHCHDARGRAVASSRCTPHRAVVCTTGVPCGRTCIPKNRVCRRR